MRWLVACAVCAGCKYAPSSVPATGDAAVDSANIVDMMTVDERTDPWLKPWLRRKSFSLLASKVDAPLADFPVLIGVTDPDLAAHAKVDGLDIVFTAGDAVTPLATEIEQFNSSDGTLVAWVKIPDLSATTDTPLYVYYDNASPPQPTPETVWTSSYLGVWHLSQDPSTSATLDSSANNRDGNPDASLTTNDLVAGLFSPAYSFDGINQYIDFAASLEFTNTFTISMWLNLSSASTAGIKTLVATTSSGANNNGFRFFVNTNGTADHAILFETGNNTASNTAQTAGGAIPVDQWKHVTLVADHNGGQATILVDGAPATNDTTTLNDYDTSNDFEVARMKGGLRWHGMLDEIEIANVLRPTEWIHTSFVNQSDPAGFRTAFADEERF